MNTRLTNDQLQHACTILRLTLREARENQFMTLYTAAELSGMDVNELEDFEAGRLDPDFIGVVCLGRVLGIDVPMLFDRALAEWRQEPPGAASS